MEACTKETVFINSFSSVTELELISYTLPTLMLLFPPNDFKNDIYVKE